MNNFINKTKQISAFIFEPSSPQIIRPSPRTWRKGVDFKRLSCTSWDEVEINQMQRISVPKGPFKVLMVPCESQPSSCLVTWHITPCMKVPGRTRRCKVVQGIAGKVVREFSANMTCFDEQVMIWGKIKDSHVDGEDFQLNLIAPKKTMRYCEQQLILVEGELKRWSRKKNTDFVSTHEAMILA